MSKPIWAFVLWLVSSTSVFALDFTRYHSQDEINAYMRATAQAHPELVRFHRLGYSEGGREIDYVVVSKADPDALPAIYMNGTHHGNEKSSTEGVVALLEYLVSHQSEPTVSSLLETYAIYIQPLVNPDGHAANTRWDLEGRDPNRDYAYPERDDADSFKIQSIKLVKELADRVRFRAAVAYHSGMEGVLWPWCYTGARNPEQDTFYTLSKNAAQAMHMPRYAQSYSDYETLGEFIDYVYMAHGTLSVSFEVSNEPTPSASRLTGVVNRSVAGALAFMLSVKELDQGQLLVERAPRPTPRVASNGFFRIGE
jgi:predicted deacylase